MKTFNDIIERDGAAEIHDGTVYRIWAMALTSAPTILVRGLALEIRPSDLVPGSRVEGDGSSGQFWIREPGSRNSYPVRAAREYVVLEEYQTEPAPAVRIRADTRYHQGETTNNWTWQRITTKGWRDIDALATRVSAAPVAPAPAPDRAAQRAALIKRLRELPKNELIARLNQHSRVASGLTEKDSKTEILNAIASEEFPEPRPSRVRRGATPAAVRSVVAAHPTAEPAEVARRLRAGEGAAASATWGTPGTQAEAYKRLIMGSGSEAQRGPALTTDEIHAAVIKELGVAKAGPRSYVGWYRNWLIKHGHRPPPRVETGTFM